MRILALEVENAAGHSGDTNKLFRAEAMKVWDLQQKDVIRDIFFRADQPTAVLMLECADLDEATAWISQLPLLPPA